MSLCYKIYSIRNPNRGRQVVTISNIGHKVVVKLSDTYCILCIHCLRFNHFRDHIAAVILLLRLLELPQSVCWAAVAATQSMAVSCLFKSVQAAKSTLWEVSMAWIPDPMEYTSTRLAALIVIQCRASNQLQCFVLFSSVIYDYCFACKAAAVSTQQQVEHVKFLPQNITT